MITKNTHDFIAKLQNIEGWLFDDTILVTAACIKAMAECGVAGPFLEIGVYKGKYLAAIQHCAEEYGYPNATTIGLDVFWFSKPHEPASTFDTLFGADRQRLTMHTGNSKDYNGEKLVELCGGIKPAFISVDGDHQAWPVLHDHIICADALERGGIIASDDVFNTGMIPVLDGISRFFIANNRYGIVPLAYCANKLYSCHREYHSRYQDVLTRFCEENPELPPAKRFLAGKAQSMWVAGPEFFGASVFLM